MLHKEVCPLEGEMAEVALVGCSVVLGFHVVTKVSPQDGHSTLRTYPAPPPTTSLEQVFVTLNNM